MTRLTAGARGGVRAASASCGTVVAEQGGGLSIQSCEVTKPSVAPGEDSEALVTVQNTGTAEAFFDLLVFCGNVQTTIPNLSLNPDTAVEYTVPFATPESDGVYDVEVDYGSSSSTGVGSFRQ